MCKHRDQCNFGENLDKTDEPTINASHPNCTNTDREREENENQEKKLRDVECKGLFNLT
jgi:hypothetical protein